MFGHWKLVLWIYFVLYALCFLICDSTVYAQPISSTELISNAKRYDAQTVVYTGEVIGDVMARGNYAWVNINDGKAAIGIWIDMALTREILFTGSYKSKGDWIEVIGTFHRACLEHGGDLDIHAQGMRKVASGRNTAERLNPDKRNFAIILLGILFVLWILRVLKRK